jgi:hypothetical protein
LPHTSRLFVPGLRQAHRPFEREDAVNAHSRRTILRRRNFALLTALLLSLAVCGLAAGRQDGGGGRKVQLPPDLPPWPSEEELKKEFNDDDLKVLEESPRGMGYGMSFDMPQFNDTSVPAAIGAMQSLSGGGKFRRVIKIKRVQIKNRSPKAVNSVQLRWTITGEGEPEKVLLEGTTMFANIWVEANSSKVVEIPTIYPSLLFKPLAQDGLLRGKFQLTFGLQEIRFADGSFWRRA